MSKFKLKKLLPFFIFFMAFCAVISTNNCKADTTDSSPEISYRGHVQNIGWQSPVSSKVDTYAGTIGQALRVEALKMNLVNAPGNSDIIYEAHVQNIGWQKLVKGSDTTALAGTEGKSLRVEAFRIRLQGDITNNYSVQYKAHVQNIGWMDWTQDGQIAGTVGKSLRVEAIKIRLVPKVHPESISITPTDTLKIGKSHTLSAAILPSDTTNKNVNWISSNPQVVSVDNNGTITAKSSGSAIITAICEDGGKPATCTVTVPEAEPSVEYSAHVQNIGWQTPVTSDSDETENTFAGTMGKSLRVEAVKINLLNAPSDASITYQAHVQNIGWMNPVSTANKSTNFAGTTGQGLRVEAIRIKLNGMNDYLLQYRAHVQNIGWMKWIDSDTDNTAYAGTMGQSLRVEAIEIRLVKKVPPSSISLNKSETALKVGQSDTLSAVVNPDNATNKNVSWSSSNPEVVSVDNNGNITAVRQGTEYIYATSVTDSKIVRSCKVTVSNENALNVVTFKDKYLETAVRNKINKPTGTLYVSDVVNIESLTADGSSLGGKITDLSGIEKLVSLKLLDLSNNAIDNIDSLGSLKNLQSLDLTSNNLVTISSLLKNLTELDSISMVNDQIGDLSPLYNLPKLQYVHLNGNTKITQEDVNKLKSNLPSCKVITFK